jgi:hypothetical protein
MLLRSIADDEYWSEYGVMVVIDGSGDDDLADAVLDPELGLDSELLTVSAMGAQPGGTVAHGGAGWLWGRVGWMDSYHVVRLEAHDAPPPDDHGHWEEVLETPYWSHSGTVAFSTLTGGRDEEAGALELGPPGLYRVRVSCVRDFSASRSDEYRPLRKTPPGFARPSSKESGAVRTGQGDDEGTFEEGDIWRLQFWPSPRDAEPPRWLTRFEHVSDPAGEDGEEPPGCCLELATDLITVVLWTPGGAVGTLADIAARLLASPAEVRTALRTAVSAGQLRVTGDLADDAAPLTLTPLPAPPPDPGEPQPLVTEDLLIDIDEEDADNRGGCDDEPAGDRVTARVTAVVRPAALFAAMPSPSRQRLPDGPPPTAGIITANRELVVWRAGLPAILATVEQYTERALATPYGIAVIGSKRAVLVRPDGEQVQLAPDPDFRVVLGEDGRTLAMASVKFGRRPKFRVYLADLADGSAQAIDCPDIVSIECLHGGVVTYRMNDDDEAAFFSWEPGQVPRRVPHQEGEADRRTGTRLSVTEPREFLAGDYLITRPNGIELTVPRRYDAQDSHLSPGGRWLYDFWYDPPTMTVTEIVGPTPGPLTTWPIPAGCATEPVSGRRPVWEDATHILLTVPYGLGAPAIRVDAETGATERLRLDRQGQGEQGQYGDGAEFDVEGFVEPFRSSAEAVGKGDPAATRTS